MCLSVRGYSRCDHSHQTQATQGARWHDNDGADASDHGDTWGEWGRSEEKLLRALYPVSRVNWCKWGIRQPLGECSASHHSLNIIPLSLHFPSASHGKWTVKDKSEASMSGKQLFWSELKLLSCDGKIRNRDMLPSSGIISSAARCSVWFLRQEDIFLKGPPQYYLTETSPGVWDWVSVVITGDGCTNYKEASQWWGHSHLSTLTPFTSSSEQWAAKHLRSFSGLIVHK